MGKSKDLATGASAFYQDQTESDARYVNTAGDTMTGNLGVNSVSASPVASLNIGNTSSDGTVDFTKGIVFSDTYGTVANVNNDTTPWVHAGIVTTGSSGFNGNLIFATDGDANRNANTSALTERMRIDHAGRVTMPHQPMFKAGRNSNYTPGTGNNVVFNSTNASYHHNVGGHYSTSNGRFTAPVTGIYHFGCCIIWGPSVPDGTDMADSFQFRKNGTLSAYSMRRAEYVNGTTGNAGYYTDFCFYDVHLSANDYINVYCQESVSLHGNERYSWFYGHLVG